MSTLSDMNKPESLAEDQRSAASAWPTVPVGPAAGGAPRSMRLSAGHAESGADGAVNQVGPSGMAHGSSELVKARPTLLAEVDLAVATLDSSCMARQSVMAARHCGRLSQSSGAQTPPLRLGVAAAGP